MWKRLFGTLLAKIAWRGWIQTLRWGKWRCHKERMIVERLWYVRYSLLVLKLNLLLTLCAIMPYWNPLIAYQYSWKWKEYITYLLTLHSSIGSQGTVYSLFRGDGATEQDLASAGHSGRWVTAFLVRSICIILHSKFSHKTISNPRLPFQPSIITNHLL